MRPLLAQTDKKTVVTLDRLRLLYFTNLHYNEKRNAPSGPELLSCFTMDQSGTWAARWTGMSEA